MIYKNSLRRFMMSLNGNKKEFELQAKMSRIVRETCK